MHHMSHYGVIIVQNKMYCDDGFGNYIETDIRLSMYSMYNYTLYYLFH